MGAIIVEMVTVETVGGGEVKEETVVVREEVKEEEIVVEATSNKVNSKTPLDHFETDIRPWVVEWTEIGMDWHLFNRMDGNVDVFEEENEASTTNNKERIL